jgi:hypothetical protein
MLFSVDSSLLGESFMDSVSGLTISIPARWQRLSEAVVDRIQAGIEANRAEPGRMVPEIMALFSLQEHESHLVVGHYDQEQAAAGLDTLLGQQRAGLEAQFPGDNVLFDKFLHNDTRFEQLHVIGPEVAIIKLFIQREGRGIYHIEYVAHQSWYETHPRSIESSIGTIRFKQ